MKSLKKMLIDFFGNIRIYPGGFILFGNSAYKLKGPDWREILNIIQPGDIVLNAHDNYVSSWFIKGDFGHVGLYVGNDKIIHVRTDGIFEEDILTFLRADNAAIVRPTNQTLVRPAIAKAYEYLGKKVEYDYDFNKNDTLQFYCSEFTDFCYNYLLNNSVSANNKFIYPDDYLIPSEHFNIIWRKN